MCIRDRDVAFHPQVNEFKGERTVQMNLVDIRPSCNARCDHDATGYSRLRSDRLESADAEALYPDRQMLGTVWRYLAQVGRPIQESPMCLCRKIVRWSDSPMSLGQLLTCLDIFSDVGLLQIQKMHKHLLIQLTPGQNKADLNTSKTMQRLLQAKES